MFFSIIPITAESLGYRRKLGVANADPGGDREPLRVLVGADRRIDQLVGHGIRQIGAMIVGDQLQHQVDRGRAAGGGDPVAVYHEDGLRESHLLEVLGETVLVLPVDGRAPPVEQPRPGERVSGRAKPAHHGAAPRLAPQPVHDLARGRGLHVEAAADEDRVLARHLVEAHVELVSDAGRTLHGIAALARDPPDIEIAPGHAIGDTQRLDRAGEAEHREPVEQQEDEPARPGVGGWAHAAAPPMPGRDVPAAAIDTENSFSGRDQVPSGHSGTAIRDWQSGRRAPIPWWPSDHGS